MQSKDLEQQMMPGLLEGDSRLRKRSVAKEDKESLSVENKVVLALETKILELITTIESVVGSFQEVNARAVKTEKDLQNVQ